VFNGDKAYITQRKQQKSKLCYYLRTPWHYGDVETFDNHASAVAQSCNHHTRAIHHIGHLLTLDLAQTLACSLILSRVDYCNSVLHGAPSINIQKLHWVQINASRIVLQALPHIWLGTRCTCCGKLRLSLSLLSNPDLKLICFVLNSFSYSTYLLRHRHRSRLTALWCNINFVLLLSRLYGSTSCCISHGPCQWERAIFDPPRLRYPLTDFHETWNI